MPRISGRKSRDVRELQAVIRPFPYNGGELLIVGDSKDVLAYNTRTETWSLVAKDPLGVVYGQYGSFAFRMSILPLPKIKCRYTRSENEVIPLQVNKELMPINLSLKL